MTIPGVNVAVALRLLAAIGYIHRFPTPGKLAAVRLKNLKTGAQWESPVDGLFAAIGHQPNTAIFLKGKIDRHPNEYVKVAPGTTQTSVPGVFAAGDVADFTYRQAVAAAGTGLAFPQPRNDLVGK